jgi:Bacterial membrane protein YfhO
VSDLVVAETADSERQRATTPADPRRWLPDVLGMLWVLAAPVAMLLPALVHGLHIGPFDLLPEHGLSAQSGVVPHRFNNGDQIDAMIPWTMLSWTEVHHGLLPLWNPYNGVGMPLAFNWQSAPFSVPNLLGYLFPLQYAYTVSVLAMLMITGAGAYVLGRVLRLGVLASAMAGTVFELSGPITGWLGYPLTTVLSWTGWLVAVALLIIGGRRRMRDIALFALLLACAVYGGQPEALVVLGLALAIFLVIVIPLRARSATSPRPILRPVGDLVVAVVAGGALAAPLALPGLQLAAMSVRQAVSGATALQGHGLIYIIFQGYDGLPVVGSFPFGYTFFYQETAAYVGVITVVLAIVAVGVRGRRPEVLGLAGITVAMAGITFIPPLAHFIGRLPIFGGVDWLRALMPMVFGLAVLAGVGLDALVRSWTERTVRWWVGGGFVLAAVGFLLLWVFDRGHLSALFVMLRNRSFIWPTVDVAIGLIVVAGLTITDRRRRRNRSPRRETNGEIDAPIEAPARDHGIHWHRAGLWAGLALLTFETAFLVVAGAPLVSSSPQGLTTAPAEATLQRAVGSSTVGFGGPNVCADLGIVPNVNDAYGVHELGIYDPITPKAYYQAWAGATHQLGGIEGLNEFCPVVRTAAIARLWGVSFVLEPHGAPGPAGSVFDIKIGNEDLYRIPGAADATLTPATSTGGFPKEEATGTPLAVVSSNPAKWKVTTNASTPQVLRLRLADVPGWRATIDGQPLTLEKYSGIMLQAYIPPGRHIVRLNYWPSYFTLGLVLAASSAIGLITALLIDRTRRRHRAAGPQVGLVH